MSRMVARVRIVTKKADIFAMHHYLLVGLTHADTASRIGPSGQPPWNSAPIRGQVHFLAHLRFLLANDRTSKTHLNRGCRL